MIELLRTNVKIKINLDNGLYVFDCENATGKTRLLKELKNNQKQGENVFACTYDDLFLLGSDSMMTEQDFNAILVPDKYSVIMLDRYNLYNGMGASAIISCMKNSIILIDCKRDLNIAARSEWCTINMTPNMIEVFK